MLLSLLSFYYETIASVLLYPGMSMLPCPHTAVFLRKSLGFPSWDSPVSVQATLMEDIIRRNLYEGLGACRWGGQRDVEGDDNHSEE